MNEILEFQRTQEKITCGITNIPLTRPAKLFFVIDTKDKESIKTIQTIYSTYQILYKIREIKSSEKTTFISYDEIPSAFIKTIWRNFKTLHPKFQSNWRYPLWELDSRDDSLLQEVISIYKLLRLPVYIHKTLRGYHFICIKPITVELHKYAMNTVQVTNPTFPRISLRIKPNKYIDEDLIFNEGWIVSDARHADTYQLRDWIISQNYTKIGEHYQLVYYPFEGKEDDRFI